MFLWILLLYCSYVIIWKGESLMSSKDIVTMFKSLSDEEKAIWFYRLLSNQVSVEETDDEFRDLHYYKSA
jgi:hypothetical protein